MGHRYSIIPYVNLPEGWLGPVTGETEGQTIDRLPVTDPWSLGSRALGFLWIHQPPSSGAHTAGYRVLKLTSERKKWPWFDQFRCTFSEGLQREVRNLWKVLRAPGQRSHAIVWTGDHPDVWKIRHPDARRIKNWVRDPTCRLITFTTSP